MTCTNFLEIYMYCDGFERMKKMGLLGLKKSQEKDK